MNICVIVNRDRSIEIISSTTKERFPGKSMIYLYADGDIPDEDLPIQYFYVSSRNRIQITWNNDEEKLKPGKYFAVIGNEFSADIGVPRAYFTIPAIEQWWTPQPTATPAPTPTEEPTPSVTPKPTAKKTATPVKTTTPVPVPSSGGNSVQIIAYSILGVVICAEFAVIIYLIKRKK
ncbi:MAG: hypothetical protein KIC77_10595 [Clostridiales bacterium]|nr:hypothetical protein [Clostridiales bacterium]